MDSAIVSGVVANVVTVLVPKDCDTFSRSCFGIGGGLVCAGLYLGIKKIYKEWDYIHKDDKEFIKTSAAAITGTFFGFILRAVKNNCTVSHRE